MGDSGKEEFPYILVGTASGSSLQSFFAIEKSTKQIVSPAWHSVTVNLQGITYDNQYLYLGISLKIEVFDIETKTHIPNYFPNTASSPWCLWSDDERIYAVGSFTDKLFVMNKYSKTLETGWPSFPNSMYEVLGEGDLIYIAGGGSTSQGYHIINKSNKEIVSGYPAMNNSAYGLSFDSQFIYLGGAFTGTNMNRFAVVDKVSKELQSGWPSFTSQQIWSVADDSERIYVGGSINQTNAVRFAVINKSTKQIETGWPSFNNTIRSLVIDDKYIYLGGDFTGAGMERFAVINKQTKQLESGWPSFTNGLRRIKI